MRKRKQTHLFPRRTAILFTLFLAVIFGSVLFVSRNHLPLVAAQTAEHKVLKPVTNRSHRPVCGTPAKGQARCHARIVTDTAGSPLANNATPYASSYGPVQFHTAYNLPCTPGGPVQANCPMPSSFGGQTIAIVDAFHTPNIESDLNTYSTYYNLPACTKANGCLTVVNQNGGTTLPTTVNSGWAMETSMDVEIAHMVCQTCKILLVEANSNSFVNLGTAVNTAARLGATEISNSYGGSEWSGETSYDSYFNHPGIAQTVSSGDSGYGAEFPAASQYVVAVGGTTLQLNMDNTYGTESVWNGAGSGCSAYEPANSWQQNLSNWSQTGCGTKRAIADVSADADPNTGAAVYDSTAYNGSTGWFQIGGTSLAAPLIAGMYALSGGVPASTNAASIPYASFSNSNSHDVTNGSNGTCTSIMCTGGTGYDGPSGLGTGYGGNSFQLNSGTTPTDTPTPSLTTTPTATPTPTPTTPPGQTTTFGYTAVGNLSDSYDQNHIDGSRFRTGSTNGALKSITVYVGSVTVAPYNKYQVAVYADNNGKPGTLIANSATGTLTANSWNTLAVSATLQANTYYWLVYNTNSLSSSRNTLRFINTSALMGVYSSNKINFGTWPTTFTSTLDGYEYSIYATYTTL